MSEEYLYYASTQYLGKSGITHKCMLAMAAIVTSAFRPQKMTAVIGQFGNPPHTRETVLFLVWDWLYPGITIISDGFSTHGGEGGAGLSTVLGLIKFYNIPLQQVRIHEKKAFDELADGTLTEEMFDTIQEEAQDYNWKFHPVSAVRKVKRGTHDFLEAKRADGHTLFDMQLP